MKDVQILTSQVIVPEFELLNIPLDDIQDMVADKLEQGFAHAIGESDCVTTTEYADFSQPAKVFRAEVVVMTKDEYKRLREIEDMFESLVLLDAILKNNL